MGQEAKQYIKKPVIVQAYKTDRKMIIHTLEGNMIADPGDYIVTGIKGEKYPCKPDIFHKTYDLLEQGQAQSSPQDRFLYNINFTSFNGKEFKGENEE